MENANSGQNIGGLFQRSRGDERKPVELWRGKGWNGAKKKTGYIPRFFRVVIFVEV